MSTQPENSQDLASDPFMITVCGVYHFPEKEWRPAITRFLKEMRSNSRAAQSEPSIRFGTVTLKFDPNTERYYAFGARPDIPQEKALRAVSETDGGMMTIGNDQREVENALACMIRGDEFMKLFLHFDMSRRSQYREDGHSRSFPSLYFWKLRSGIEYTVTVNGLPIEDPMLERSMT